MGEEETKALRRQLDKERAALRARVRFAASFPEGIVGSAPGKTVIRPPVAISFEYDPQEDLLFAWVGDPQPAITQDGECGIHLRLDPDSYRIVGFEVVDYLKGAGEARNFLDRLFPGLSHRLDQQHRLSIELPSDKVTAKLRKLVPESWPNIFQDPTVLYR